MPGLEPVGVKYLPQVERLLWPQLSRHAYIHVDRRFSIWATREVHTHTYIHVCIYTHTYMHILGAYTHIYIYVYISCSWHQESECKFNMQHYSPGFPSTLQYHLHAKVTKMKNGRQWDLSPASQTTMSQLHSDPSTHFCKILKELVTICFSQLQNFFVFLAFAPGLLHIVW